MNESIGPAWDPNSPASQPRSNTAWTIPSEAPIESRFISAACTGITNERKTTSSSSAASATTTPMNNGSLLARTWEKSTCAAVAPPTYTRAPTAPLDGRDHRVTQPRDQARRLRALRRGRRVDDHGGRGPVAVELGRRHGHDARACSSRRGSARSAPPCRGACGSATASWRGPLKPGPNPLARRSNA